MPSLSLKIVLDEGAVTRKVKFDSRITVREAHKIVKEKVIVPKGKEYGLFLRSADEPKCGVWLEDERTLDNYMLRDGDSLDYICRVRNLRIKLLDGTVKTMQVDEAKTVADLMLNVCARIGIKNHDEYGLCHQEEEMDEDKESKDPPTGTLTLKRKHPPKETDETLKELSKKLRTDDYENWVDQHRTLREQGVDATETLILKRRLFFSDRNVDSRDPVQLNLLFVQTRDAILNGRHPVTEQQAAECKVRWINIRDVHRRILKKNITEPTQPPRVYKYESELIFMKPFYKDVVILSTVEDDEEEAAQSKDWTEAADADPVASDDSDEPIKKPKPKKKKAKKRKEPCFEEVNETIPSFSEPQTSELDPADPVDAFLLSIGSTLKTFSPYHLNIAKSKIFAVVQDHDLQQIVESQKSEANSEVNVSTSQTIFI